MVALIAALLGTIGIGTLVGWFVHWLMHQSWSGKLYRSHMTHHLKRYPPKDLLSDVYRDAGEDDGAFIFFPAITLIVGLLGSGLYVLGVSPWVLGCVALLSTFIGVGHDRLHTEFHLTGTWFARFAWFRTLRTLHFYHHRNLKKNLGIVWFFWDRLLSTYRRP